MTPTKPKTLAAYLPVLAPGAILFLLVVIPFGTMVQISFYKSLSGGLYDATFTLTNYQRLFSPLFYRLVAESFTLAFAVAAVSLILAFPFCYLLVNAPRSTQVVWLILLLSVLSLSESIIGFAWSTLLSRTAGISNLFVWLGLLEAPVSYVPGFGALVSGIVYTAFPYAVLVLYPILVRVDPSIEEAARTLGTSPLTTFFKVVLPMQRNTLVTTFLMVFIFALGSYLMPQILGRPQNWTLSVAINDQALQQSNIPFAAALALFLVLTTALLACIMAQFRLRDGTR